jgi:MFS family permease
MRHETTAPAMTHTPPDRWFIAHLVTGTLPAIFSYVAIGIAIPGLQHEFGVGPATVHWVASAFIAAMMGGMLAASTMLARFGLKASLVAAALAFSVASVWAAVSQDFWMLVAARFVMGLSGGLAQPLAFVVLFEAFPGARGKATALLGVTNGAAATLAPTLAGLLVDLFSWRAIFVAPIPFALAFLLAARRAPKRERSPQQRFDILGLLALHVALLALLGLEMRSFGRSDTDWIALGMLGGAAALLAYRQANAATPLFARSLFRHRGYVVAAFCATVYGALLFGYGYLVPIYLQVGLGTSAMAAGLWMLPQGIVLIAAIHVAGPRTDGPSYRPILQAGFAVLMLASAAMGSPLLAGTALAVTAWATLARGGMGFVFCGINTGATRVVPDRLLPEVPGATNFFRFLGGAIGIKVVSALVAYWPATAAINGFQASFLFLAVLALLAIPTTVRMIPFAPAASPP